MRRVSIECLLLAGLGGTMPALTRTAGDLVNGGGESLPGPGYLIGLGIFFLLGALIVYIHVESNLRKAFFLGVAAPALISGVIGGIDNGNAAPVDPATGNNVTAITLLAPAYAETVAIPARTVAQSGVYRYQIISHLPNASNWQTRQLTVRVELVLDNGRRESVILPAGGSLDTTTRAPAREVIVAVGDARNSVSVPAHRSGKIEIRATVTGNTDLLWALGGKRRPNVTAVDVRFTPRGNA